MTQKESGAVRIHALVAPSFWGWVGWVVHIISVPRFLPPERIAGKAARQGRQCQTNAMPKYAAPVLSVWENGLPCSLATMRFCLWGSAQEPAADAERNPQSVFSYGVSLCLIRGQPPDGLWLSGRQDSRPNSEAYGGVRTGIQPGCKSRVFAPWVRGQAGAQSSHGYSRVR